MSWSLQIENGDFTLSGSSLGTVNGSDKMVQDLACCLMEKMGHDTMHPDYGSMIDGGVTPQGIAVDSVIGKSPQEVAATVESEIQRIAAAYQAQQLTRVQSDNTTYGRSTITPNEALISISNLTMTQTGDTILVSVTLQTALNDSVTVTVPVTS